MPVTRKNLAEVIQSAWNDATGNSKIKDCAREKCLCEGEEEIDLRKRSRIWVCGLARQFRNRYTGGNHRVFWRDSEENRTHFSLNELLFDISVCNVGTAKSFQGKTQSLEYISGCHWQIESEFNKKNSREVIVDMSKLVMGSAQNKLMIASHRNGSRARATEREVLLQCEPIAASCTKHLFFCFVSHPAEWVSAKKPSLYEWTRKGWMHLAGPKYEGSH